MDLEQLLREYEGRGDESTYRRAKDAYEAALAVSPDEARLHHQYGYLHECHARNELRSAAARYERAIALDPEWAKPRFQLLMVRAALLEIEDAIKLHRERVAADPQDVDGYRLLVTALLLAHRTDEAEAAAIAGLRVAPEDAVLVRARGEAAAAAGRVDAALAFWRRSLELDANDISALYSSAFLLEREGRTAEAADTWRSIGAWCRARGYELEAEWPKREIARLEAIQPQT